MKIVAIVTSIIISIILTLPSQANQIKRAKCELEFLQINFDRILIKCSRDTMIPTYNSKDSFIAKQFSAGFQQKNVDYMLTLLKQARATGSDIRIIVDRELDKNHPDCNSKNKCMRLISVEF